MRKYGGTPLNGHLSVADITDNSESRFSIDFSISETPE